MLKSYFLESVKIA